MNFLPKAPIHIAKSLKHQPHKPRLVKEYVCPTHDGKLKRTTLNEKHENLTKCIVNALSSYFQHSLQFDTLVI